MRSEHAGAMGAIQDGLGERYERLPIGDFLESKLNPRKTFDAAKLEELAASIREKGVIEPIVARQVDAGSHKPMKFEIIAGARRYRASKIAGLTHVPAIIRIYTDVQAVEVMTIENDQRDDVPPLEQAAGYKQLLLIDKTYTPAMLAERTGHPVKFIWDRLRLLELVPAAQKHLEAGRIGIEHAEILAKLKPAEQERAIHPQNGGLFDQLYLAFEDGEKDGPLERLKVKTVRELKAWIARHVRFDVQHAAAASPLEFGPVAERVEQAQAEQPVPVVHISDESEMHPDAQTKEKTYVATAWRRADGKDKSKPCEHAILGVVVTGQRRGQAFNVCIAREKCRVHFGDEIKQKEKNAQLRQKGQGAKASQNEVRDRLKAEAKRKEIEQARAFWQKLEPLIIEDAVDQVKKAKALPAAVAKRLSVVDIQYDAIEIIEEHLGKSWFKSPAAAWMVIVAADHGQDSFDDYVKDVAKPLGLNVKRLEAIRDKHQAAPAAAPKAKGKKAKAA